MSSYVLFERVTHSTILSWTHSTILIHITRRSLEHQIITKYRNTGTMSERHASEFRNRLETMQRTFRNEFKALKRPSVLRRRWFEVATGGAVMCYFVYFSVTRPGRLGELRRQVQNTSSDFILEHVTDPISSLWNEIILQKGYDVIDASEVLDSKRSLDIMLRDFFIMQCVFVVPLSLFTSLSSFDLNTIIYLGAPESQKLKSIICVTRVRSLKSFPDHTNQQSKHRRQILCMEALYKCF